MGTTGSSISGKVNTELPDIIARIRQYTNVPLAVGFGVATRAHFEYVASAGADGVVIGSRLVEVMREAPEADLAERVKTYCSEISLAGQPQPPTPPAKLEGKVTTPVVNVAQTGPSIANTSSDPTVLPARFGEFGGQYVPEALVDALVELEAAHKAAMADPAFWEEWRSLYGYMNRPSNLYFAERLTEEAGGAKIWLKREDL
jgi:tryptophan synthase